MQLHEIQFIERLRKLAGGKRGSGRLGTLRLREGIGDDCAVISTGSASDLLVTTDLFIEDIHFRRAWQEPYSIGHKVLTRGLSDIAAMGGTPRMAFLSLALPRKTSQRWVDYFLDGLLALAAKYQVVLAGGDTGSSPAGFMADIMIVGEVPAGTAVLRTGARTGDEVWVSGALGGASAELRKLRTASKIAMGRASRKLSGSNVYFFPQARVAIGQKLRGVASAMMDISDGLSIDLSRLAQASGVGATLDAAAIPLAATATLDDAMNGGDDFELLFTVPRRNAKHVPKAFGGVPLRRIGSISKQRSLRIVMDGVARPLQVHGFQHF